MSSDRFQDSAQAAMGAAGTYSVTFQSVRLGYILTGSVQIPDAPPTPIVPVKFTAFDAGVPIGSWYNDQSSGNLQVQQQLSITASGLVAGTYRAFFKGMITDAATTPPFWPGPTPAPPPGAPQVLTKTPSPNQSILANSTVSIGTAPASGLFSVIVGTSLEVVTFNPSTAMQLKLTWFTAVAGDAVSPYTFDVAAGALLSGLVLPNLAPFVAVQVANSNGAGTLGSNIFTGLPPIARPPVITSGDLTRYNAAIADGGDSGEIVLPPYVGDAQLFLTALVAGASPAAGAIFARLTSQDYLGVSSELARVGATTQFLAASGTTSLQPAYVWKMGPRINSIRVFNRIGGGTAVTVSMAISVSGP
jgi:hypothetical protein